MPSWSQPVNGASEKIAAELITGYLQAESDQQALDAAREADARNNFMNLFGGAAEGSTTPAERTRNYLLVGLLAAAFIGIVLYLRN